MSVAVLAVDLGGVVSAFRPGVRMDRLVALTGSPAWAIEEQWWGSGLETRAELGELGPDAVYDALREALGVDADRELLRQIWTTAFAPDRDVLEVVGRVRVPTALFTNNGPVVSDGLDHELVEIRDRFDRSVCSWELGHRKPSAGAFLGLAHLLGVEPAEIVFVDDSAANVNGARAVGIDAVAFTSATQLEAALIERGLLG